VALSLVWTGVEKSIMRPLALALSVLAAGALAAPAHAHDMHLHASCSVHTDYDVDVQPDGVHFARDSGTPRQVLMHDGRLQVDGRPLAVGTADAARLRQYEANVRALVPEVAGIAHEGVDIGFDALTTVAATFAETPAERDNITRQLTTQRERALLQLEQGLGHGHWHQHGLDRLFDDHMGDAVSELVSTVAGRAVKAALSGDQTQVQALQARADSLEKTIDKTVDARADRLGERADALCPRLVELDQLQQRFTFHLPDGSPLSLMQLEREDRETVTDARTH
jgi:hypothetical protein